MTKKSREQYEKEQRKYAQKRIEERKENLKELDNMNQIEKMELQIANIKSSIKNCEYDLAGMFKNNIAIENKVESYKIWLEQNEQNLLKLKNIKEDSKKKCLNNCPICINCWSK